MSRRNLFTLFIFCSLFAKGSLEAETVINIKDFDPACGQAQHNCHDAFQKAFAAAAKAGGAVVQLPSGTFFIDYPGLANDNQPGKTLDAATLLSVPPRVSVRGHSDNSGNLDSVIEWKITSIPVFLFANASNSGMNNLHLRFTGVTPQSFPYSDNALLRALGYKPTYALGGQMGGGNYEMFSFAYLFDSDHCVFENLLFDSATHDNQHVMGFALNAKGKGVVVAGGAGGVSGDAEGNRFSNIRIYDDVMGLLIAGQENLVVENIFADRRGSTAKIAPGHVIYFTNTNTFAADGKTTTVIVSKNVKVSNVSEGPETYGNQASLGTLAVKYIDGGIFEHVSSQHPLGLIQSLVSVQHVTFDDMTWSSDSKVCEAPEGPETPSYCGTPVIESVADQPGNPPMGNLKFSNIHLKSPRPIITNVIGKTIDIDGITIETSPLFRKVKAQSAPYGVLSVKQASDVTVKNFVYIPVISSMDTGARYNQPFICWGDCSNIKADVTIKWPAALAQPAKGNPVITSVIQFDKPGANNSITSHIDAR